MWGIIASVAGPVIGGLIGSNASENAADAQVQAGEASNATQLAMFNQNREDFAPWREAGVNALNKVTGQLDYLNKPFTNADFVKDPGYQFRLGEGERSINRAAAARGTFGSGGTMKALTRYGQDYASGEFANAYNRYNADRSNIFNRLSAIAGTGQTATNQVGQMGAQTARDIGQTQQGMGNARASGYVGQANAFTNAIGTGLNAYNQQQMINALNNRNYGGYTGANAVDYMGSSPDGGFGW